MIYMKINKKQFTIILVICVAILLFLLGYYIDKHSLVKEFNEALDKENSIIVIEQEGCQWCIKFEPVIKEVSEEYNLTYVSLKINTLLNSDYKMVFKKLNVDEFGTPSTFIVSNNIVKDMLEGYVEKDKLIEFLIENNIIEG